MRFSTTCQPGQFVIDSSRISVYHVAVQPRSSCSLQQWRIKGLTFTRNIDIGQLRNGEKWCLVMRALLHWWGESQRWYVLRVVHHDMTQNLRLKPQNILAVQWCGGASSGNLGRPGLYFVPKNVTMKGSIYIDILKEHLCIFWRIYQYDYFIDDGSPAHDLKIVTNFLNSHNIHVLNCLVIHQT